MRIKSCAFFLVFNIFCAYLHLYPKNYQITYVIAAIDIGRTFHGGHAQQSGIYRFEDDYLSHVIDFLKLEWPARIFIQKKYFPVIKPYLHEKIEVHFYELSDIERSQYYDHLQKCRKNLQFADSSGLYCPNATYAHYAPLVFNKIEFLMQAARDNPFKTDYFVWIDANHHIGKFKSLNHSSLVPYLDKFSMHYFMMPTHLWEIHGMPRNVHTRYCGGIRSDKLCRAMIFGGTSGSIEKVYDLFHQFAQRTLNNGHLGTEENIFTFCYFDQPQLFNFMPEPYYYRLLSA